MTQQHSGEVTSLLGTLVSVGMHDYAAILRRLVDGPQRFNELAEALPRLGDVLLGGCLRGLDAEGLVVRRVEPGPPLRVLYELTPSGAEVAPVLVALKRWTDARTSEA